MVNQTRPHGSPTCGTCKFTVEMHGATFCCCNPPIAITLVNEKGAMDTQSVFPPVNPAITWCGKHEPRIHLAS